MLAGLIYSAGKYIIINAISAYLFTNIIMPEARKYTKHLMLRLQPVRHFNESAVIKYF
jgi:hypothetical protein